MKHSLKMRGLTIVDVLVAIVMLVMLLAIVVPALARGRNDSGIAVSLNNLKQVSAALADYAADYNGRQPTAIVDDFSTYGDTGMQAIQNYLSLTGQAHPPVVLGYGCLDGGGCGAWAFWMPGAIGAIGNAGNYLAAVPLGLDETNAFGYFRQVNGRIMHWYIGRRVYDDVFFAPNDGLTYAYVEPLFDGPHEFVPDVLPGFQAIWSSYCFSPAAMFDPLVMRGPSAGGYTSPYSYADGFRSPTVSQALHPALKTRLLEYRWDQNQPDVRCIPNSVGGVYNGCEPWFFNHGAASEPATLFFDGSTGLLPNSEVIAADAQLIKQTGEGLWHRETPLGPEGYFGEFSYDGTIVSHHILTIDGIRGRDTLGVEP